MEDAPVQPDTQFHILWCSESSK